MGADAAAARRVGAVTKPTDASRIERGFPHDFYVKDLVRTFVYGGTRDLIDA